MDPEGSRPEVGESATHDRGPMVAGGKVRSTELLGDRGELIIVHAGREYRLRLTHSGKLILTA